VRRPDCNWEITGIWVLHSVTVQPRLTSQMSCSCSIRARLGLLSARSQLLFTRSHAHQWQIIHLHPPSSATLPSQLVALHTTICSSKLSSWGATNAQAIKFVDDETTLKHLSPLPQPTPKWHFNMQTFPVLLEWS